jgi:hypothetical protein
MKNLSNIPSPVVALAPRLQEPCERPRPQSPAATEAVAAPWQSWRLLRLPRISDFGFRISASAALFLTWQATAATFTFTTNTTIGVGNTAYDGQDIVIRDCTVTVAGAHAFNSLRLTNLAVLTHSPAPQGEANFQINLAIARDLTVDYPSRIEATARGYAGASGPGAGGSSASASGGGGGHGGFGGTSSAGTSGGGAYDSIASPALPGSGGGNGYFSAGGAGGGVIRLVVGGLLRLDGMIVAEGGSGLYNNLAGAGAGGSIAISAGTMSGFGPISANGGAATVGNGGGGAGGRIALTYTNSSFLGSVTAQGGAGAQFGAAGTVFTKAASAASGDVRVDNGGNAGAFTPLAAPALFNLTIANRGRVFPQTALTNVSLTLKSNGLLTHLVGPDGLNITVISNVTIEAFGRIDVTGLGYGPAEGPGAGTNSLLFGGSGGGHGGVGGTAEARGGGGYDSIVAPTQFGSGGGDGYFSTGGSGGGTVRLIVGGTLQVDGTLSADGGASYDYIHGGGGAGGSLSLTVGALRGSGAITANGGASTGAGGGGGAGGRIAIYHGTNGFTGALTAYGGVGVGRGGAGTIFTNDASATHGGVLVHNGGNAGGLTRLNPATWPVGTYFDLTVAGAAQVNPDAPLTFWNLLLNTGGVLSHDAGQSGLSLATIADARFEAGTAINVNFLGYTSGTGPGSGVASATYGGGGAGHGGTGGTATNGGAGGVIYGAAAEPGNLGSGGGPGYLSRGGTGGGIIRLSVGGLLQLDGALTANGGPGLDNGYGGGGSGGSIYVTTDILTGTGVVSANGGASTFGGGGGGGRVAIYPRLVVGFPNAPTVAGGLSGSGGKTNANGRLGTVVWSSNAAPLKVVALAPSNIVMRAVSSVTVLFGSPVNQLTFTPADVVITTPTGTISSNLIVVTPLAGPLFNVGFPVQTNTGTCQIQIWPHIENLVGREMDQNGNLIPGEIPEDIFTSSFTITRPTISGYLAATNGWPIRGATVRADDGSATTTTDSSGFYTLTLAPGWTGSVTPSASGSTFSPANRTYTSLSANQAGQNFTLSGSVIPTLAIWLQDTNAQVSWPSIYSFKYLLKSTTNLMTWQDVGTPLTGTGGNLTATIPLRSAPQKSFRLLVLPN